MRINRIRLAAALIEKDMNGQQLAERAGLCRCTVTAVRTGKSCSRTTAEKIAAALGVHLSELVEG